MTRIKEIWYNLAGFILDYKVIVIKYLNKNYNTQLSIDTPVDRVNSVIANFMLKDSNFINDFLLFKNKVEEGSYSNFIVAAATAVSILGTFISDTVQAAKSRIFNEQQALRQEQYGKESEAWAKEQAELRAKKEIAIELGKAQTDIILQRDMAEEKEKRTNTLMVFSAFAIGAIALSFILTRKK